MGSPTITKLEQPISLGGLYKEIIGYCSGPASYDSGGSVIAARDVGLTTIVFMVFSLANSADRKAHAVFAGNEVPETSVKMFITDLAGTEAAGASNQSTKKFRFKARGLY